MSNISVRYAGIKFSTNRVWGYIKQFNGSIGPDLYVFWGIKGGHIKFKWTPNDDTFRKNLWKKERIYCHQTGLKEPIQKQFEEYLLLKKLKGIPVWEPLE